MKNLFNSIRDTLLAGKPIVLVSIIASSGSTPRGTGAMMIIHEDKRTQGTIGGGAVEHAVQKQAEKLHLEKHSETMRYILAPNDVADLGMICGGNVTVYFQYLSGTESIPLFEYLIQAFDKDENAWLVRIIENNEISGMGIFDRSGLHFIEGISGDAVKPHLTTKAVYIEGTPSYYVEPVVQAGRVYIFGGGHVAQALVPVIASVGFVPVIYEDREEFADKALFPLALDTIVGSYLKISDFVKINANDYVVVMTRGHQADYEILEQVLKTDATYIGCIGSRNKVAATKKQLIADGIPEEKLNLLYSPIGLRIKADTPAEIAVSIAAELILHRASK